MTLDQWLEEATGTFPPGIRERLAQEYTTHLEDSVAADGSRDALELFGKPKEIEKRLKKFYYNQKQLTAIFGQKKWVFWIMFGLVSLGLLLSIAISLPDDFMRPVPIISISSYCIALFIMGLLWNFSKNWTSEIKVRFRNQYSATTCISSGLIVSLASSNSNIRWLTVAMLIMQIILIPLTLAEDRKLRRTLEVEAASSHQTSSG